MNWNRINMPDGTFEVVKAVTECLGFVRDAKKGRL
jgi:hypothetical protein